MDSFTDFMRTLSFRITDHLQRLRWWFSFWLRLNMHKITKYFIVI